MQYPVKGTGVNARVSSLWGGRGMILAQYYHHHHCCYYSYFYSYFIYFIIIIFFCWVPPQDELFKILGLGALKMADICRS